MIDIQKVRKKVKMLVERMGISKTKLGEILGGNPADDPRVKINRASRFLSGAKKTISLQELDALASFFEKPIDWFLFENKDTSHILASPQKRRPYDPKALQEIRKNLEKMGFNDSFIETQIAQLKAMEAYNKRNNT